jgi:hypothetical protein
LYPSAPNKLFYYPESHLCMAAMWVYNALAAVGTVIGQFSNVCKTTRGNSDVIVSVNHCLILPIVTSFMSAGSLRPLLSSSLVHSLVWNVWQNSRKRISLCPCSLRLPRLLVTVVCRNLVVTDQEPTSSSLWKLFND